MKRERRTQGQPKQLGKFVICRGDILMIFQAAVGVLVGNRLDDRRKPPTGARVAVEQDVVGVASVEEGKRVLRIFFASASRSRAVVADGWHRMHDRGRRAVVLHGNAEDRAKKPQPSSR